MSIHRRVGKRGNTLRGPPPGARRPRDLPVLPHRARGPRVRGRAADGHAPGRLDRPEGRHDTVPRRRRALAALEPGEATIHDGSGRRDSPAAPRPGLGRQAHRPDHPGRRPHARDDVAARAEAIEREPGLPDARSDLPLRRRPGPDRSLAVSRHQAADRRHRSVHVVDADELARLAKAMGDFGPMAYVAAVLGLRWGEVAGLKVGASTSRTAPSPSSEQITRGKGGQIVVGLPKSDAGRRTLSMPAALADLLSGHIDSTPRRRPTRRRGCSRRRRRSTPLRQLVPPGVGSRL